MDTRKYEAVQKVIELSSFSKAAEALNYTQSAMSQAVSSLEAELGVTLVKRSRSGAELTIEGRSLYPLIQRIVNDQRRIVDRAQEIRGLESGIIRIGALSSIAMHWLPPLMAEFGQTYPQVQFVVHSGDYDSVSEWIRAGTVDFGFVNPAGVKGVRTRMLKQGAMHAVLPAGHPLAALDRIPLRLLADEPFILLEEGGYYEPLEAFARVGIEPNVRYTIHDDHAIMGMVAAGLGVSIMATLMTDGSGYGVATRPTDPPIVRDIAIGYRDDADMPIASKRFAQMVVDHVDQLP